MGTNLLTGTHVPSRKTMTMQSTTHPSNPAAVSTTLPSLGSLFFGGLLGVAWNLFGAIQFVKTLQSTPESLMQMGMTAQQAAVYSAYPLWMNVAFALGVFGGLAGSILLLARKRLAQPVFAASLVGYVVLFVGDITEGVFAALGASQVVVLSFVVMIAAALFAWSRSLERRGMFSS
jgi:hypothetical protein